MSKAISDFNSLSGTRSQIVAIGGKRIYSDLNLRFAKHPKIKDIIPFYDLDAIKSSIRNLILSNHNDRLFHPELGSNLGSLLFEICDNFTIIAIRNEITLVLSSHEPRIGKLSIDVIDMTDQNAISITVQFSINNKPGREEVSFQLNRLR